jgi:hypothetical protein
LCFDYFDVGETKQTTLSGEWFPKDTVPTLHNIFAWYASWEGHISEARALLIAMEPSWTDAIPLKGISLSLVLPVTELQGAIHFAHILSGLVVKFKGININRGVISNRLVTLGVERKVERDGKSITIADPLIITRSSDNEEKDQSRPVGASLFNINEGTGNPEDEAGEFQIQCRSVSNCPGCPENNLRIERVYVHAGMDFRHITTVGVFYQMTATTNPSSGKPVSYHLSFNVLKHPIYSRNYLCHSGEAGAKGSGYMPAQVRDLTLDTASLCHYSHCCASHCCFSQPVFEERRKGPCRSF